MSRGKATSGAPICSGSTRFAKANTSGVAKNSSMIVPCIVNSWLYCSGDRNCMPGRASSARMISASTPPNMKKVNDVTRYIRPISLWSVVRSNCRNIEPLAAAVAGNGRLTIGVGSMSIGLAAAVGSAVVVKPASGVSSN